MCKTICRGVPLFAALLGCGCLVFLPSKYPEGNWHLDAPLYEDAWFRAGDGVGLHGWFAEAAQPRAVVLYAHGNAGNITNLHPVLRLFRMHLHASILVFDYRGYDRSEGTPCETGILADARAARRWLAKRAGVAESDIVLVGHSLGGGVAVDLAARDGARGLVLGSTFTSVPDVAASHAGGLPVRWLFSTQLDSLAKIADYHGPLLQTHGDDDRTVPFALGEKLFAAANEPKQFVRVGGGGHNDPPSREYLQALDRFLGSLPPGSPRDEEAQE
jgi:fermentation-respiration switch protein FrsA (DUF1100 family)